jgi:multidrug efflux pump subunit AcrA (membrane-fusion protein)
LLRQGRSRNDFEETACQALGSKATLRVEVFVPTAYHGQIRVGSEAEVRPEQPIGGVHVAKVAVVDHVIDAASGMFGVRLTLPNPQLALPAGIRCNVTFAMQPPGPVPALIASDAPSKE